MENNNRTAEAFESIITKYTPLVRAVCSRSLKNSADIDDCTSEVFGELWRLIEEGRADPNAELAPLVCTIAKRRAVDLWRKNKRRRVLPFDDGIGLLSDGFSLEGDFEDRETRAELIKAINSLGMPDKALLLGRYYFGEDSKTLGQRYGLSERAVNTRIHRAVKKLKKLFAVE